MNDFKFVSEKYSIQNSENYRSSIQVNPDGFSVLVADEENVMKIIHRQTGSIQESRLLFRKEEELIKLRELSFKSSTILLNSGRFSLLPAELVPASGRTALINLEFDSLDTGKLIEKEILGTGIIYNFEVGQDQGEFIRDFRNRPEVSHFSATFLSYILNRYSGEEKTIYIYSAPRILHLAMIQNSELNYYNLYNCKNDDEILYHLINSLRKLDRQEAHKILYSGHITRKDPLWTTITRYRKDIEDLPNDLSFELAGNINENYFSYLLKATGANYQR